MRHVALLLLWCLGVAGPATAQESPSKVPVIGWLSPATTESYRQGEGSPGPELLRKSLAKHGLIDGRNIRLEMRLAEGTLQTIDVRGANDLEPAFRALREGGAEGVNVVSSAMLTSFRRQIGELSLAAKIPAVCQWRNMAEAGCLASYGVTITEFYDFSAGQIARLLKGATARDLPIEQPRKFELIVNGKTAKALGLSIPPSVPLRADHVLQ